MVLIEFTKDFATTPMKKGDTMEVDSQLANVLINIKKVAKKRERKTSKEPTKE